MNAREVKTAADAKQIVEERGARHVKIGVVDLDGVMAGKYVSKAKFLSGLENGIGFCDIVLGWDLENMPLDNLERIGWHAGFGDAQLRILPESCRDLPFEESTLFFLCEFTGPIEEVGPRGVLRRVVERANNLGFSPYGALEYEFFMFEETPHSVREKGYRNLRPMTPGPFGYSLLRTTVGSDFCQALLATCEQMDFPLEGLHTETGPGVLEAAITVDGALEAADKAAMFKTFTKVLAQKRGLMATFMAKLSPQHAGQGGHIHLSLKSKDGGAIFHDAEQEHGMSQAMRHFIAGQQALMPELMAMVGSTLNSYSRLVPGLWAPTNATWGIDNRTTAIRAIPGSPKSQRVEYRVPGADSNPYLAMAAALGSGLWGIEQKLEPGEPVSGNAYELPFDEARRLPATLWDAAQRLKKSKPARELFGDAFVEHFAATREWEERVFRKHVTDWELARYFESI